jgi:hypothetical protein
MVQSQDPPALLGWVPIPAHQASSRSTGAPHSPNLTLPGYQMLVWGTGQPGRPGGLPYSNALCCPARYSPPFRLVKLLVQDRLLISQCTVANSNSNPAIPVDPGRLVRRGLT